MSMRTLKKELHEVGANKSEAAELAIFAKKLSQVKPRGLSADAKKRLAPEPEVSTYRHTGRWALAGSFAILCVLVIAAQSALPGSWLYGIKRGTEQVRTVVQPDYIDTLIDIRKEEIEELKKEEAPLERVEKAEQYWREAIKHSEERGKRGNKDKQQEQPNWRNNRTKNDSNPDQNDNRRWRDNRR